ncbi:class D sortase, partial [bacterium]
TVGKTSQKNLRTASLDPNAPAAGLPVPRKKPAPWALTKFSIPDIELETFVVQGVDSAALRRGPGHDPNSSLPGQGNCVIAGHRNVYGSFFYRLDELIPGKPIILENKNGKWTYIVNSVFTTGDTDLSVLAPPPNPKEPVLTLITCTLPHSSSRIILRADLQTEPQ